MKVKLAIIYGIVIWVLITIFSSVFNPIFTDNLPRVNIIIPLAIIIVTGFFGILYIRSMVEGILVGIVFIIIDFILDMFVFILPNNMPPFVQDYPLHLFSMIVITLLITTLLGYLAQMSIDLK